MLKAPEVRRGTAAGLSTPPEQQHSPSMNAKASVVMHAAHSTSFVPISRESCVPRAKHCFKARPEERITEGGG